MNMSCKFKTGVFSNIVCSEELLSLGTLPENDTDKLLSEIGLLSGVATKKYIICKAHKSEILKINKSRSTKRKRCAMPPELVAHVAEAGLRVERNLSKASVVKLHHITGLVLPIGIRKFACFIILSNTYL